MFDFRPLLLTTHEFAHRACLFTFATNLFFPEKIFENIIEDPAGIVGAYISAMGPFANKFFSKLSHSKNNCALIKESTYNCFYKACRF